MRKIFASFILLFTLTNLVFGSYPTSKSGGGIPEWAPATTYQVDNLVWESEKFYKALNTHISGATFPPDLAGGEWIEMSDDLNREADGTVTDNALVRWDGTTGDDVANSLVTLDDLGVMSGLTQLNVDNLRLDGNSLSSQDANGNITLDPNGTGKVVVNSDLDILGTVTNISQTALVVTNPTITVNDTGNQATADANDAGIIVEMSDATDAQIGYDSSTTSKFIAGEVGDLREIVTTTHAQDITAKTLLEVDALQLDGDTIASLSGGNIVLNPDGSGNVQLPDLTASNPLKLDGSNNIIAAAIDLTTDVSGILPVANGGTNASTLQGAGVLYMNTGGDTVQSDNSVFSVNAAGNVAVGTGFTSRLFNVNGSSIFDGTVDVFQNDLQVLGTGNQVLTYSIDSFGVTQASRPYSSMTTTERNALSLGVGDEARGVWNETDNVLQIWDGSAWQDVGANPFDQDLNTTDSPDFVAVSADQFNIDTVGFINAPFDDRIEMRTNNQAADTDVISLYTGSSSGASGTTGQLNLRTGDTTATSGDSGNILLLTGTSSNGNRGDIILNTTADQAVLANQPTGSNAFAIATTDYVDNSPKLNFFEEIDSGGPNGYFLRSPNQTTAASEAVQFFSGNVTDSAAVGNTGSTVVASGTNSGTGAVKSGNLFLLSGGSAGTIDSGFVDIFSGNNTGTAGSGDVFLRSGTGVSDSGAVNIYSGDVSNTAGTTGVLSINSGNTTLGSTGGVFLQSGNTTDAAAQTTGDVTISTGIPTNGTRGSIRLQDGSQGTAGHVWTSTGVNGEGNWEAASGGGGSRLNLIVDGSYESGVSEGTCTGCTASQDLVDVMATADNLASLEMAFTASAGDYTDTTATSAQYTNVPAETSAWIKTSADGVELCAMKDGVEDGCKEVSNTDEWKKYIIDTGVTGSTSYGYKIVARNSITDSIFVDEVYSGPIKEPLINVSAIDDWKEYTPTFTGMGTVTNVEFRYRRVGQNLEVIGNGTSGVSIATNAEISLPNSLMLDASAIGPANYIVGIWTSQYNAGDNSNNFIIAAGSTTDAVLFTRKTASNNGYSAYPANQLFGDNQPFAVKFSIPISGWTAQTKIYASSCDNFECDNTFSARVAIDASTPVVNNESHPGWIASLTDNAVGNTSVNFKSGLFSVPPVCTVSSEEHGITHNVSLGAVGNTSLQVRAANAIESATIDNVDFTIRCTKNGPDYDQFDQRFVKTQEEARFGRTTSTNYTATALGKLDLIKTADPRDDLGGMIDEGTDRYDIDKTGLYEICSGGNAGFGFTNWAGMFFRINGGSDIPLGALVPSSSSGDTHFACKKRWLDSGDYVEFFMNSGSVGAITVIENTVTRLRDENGVLIGNINPSDFAVFEDYDAAPTVTGGFTNATGSYRINVQGKVVTVVFQLSSGNSGGSPTNVLSMAGKIPSAYRPPNHQVNGNPSVVDTGNDLIGYSFINQSGDISCTLRDFTGGGFTAPNFGANQTCAGSLSWIID